MKTGLFFGSFNPIHIGHVALANYFVEFSDLDELWFVVSPHNPLKEKKTLLNDRARLEMVQEAIGNDNRFRACDIEFKLPQPSYTANTLAYLKEKHPNKEFAIIMGSDGLPTFHKWKSHQHIIDNHTRYVYPRNAKDTENIRPEDNIILVDAPKIEISSTFLRSAIQQNKNICHFLPQGVYKLIDKYGYYR